MLSNELESNRHAAINAVKEAVTNGQLTTDSGQNLQRWLGESPYSPYWQSLIRLINLRDFSELNRLFWERIPFGTGGRRGPMSEFGSATINDRTIAESAHGLAEYVLKWRVQNAKSADLSKPQAVIAFDTRHRSKEFARTTACVLAAHGFHVHFFPEARSTPELSFAVRHLHCDTGVMISASHNPPSDNGFKAYWSNGGQVLPPHDAGIIECVDAATEIPKVDFDLAVGAQQITILDHSVDTAFIDTVCRLSLSSQRGIKALYTPLHGVGETSVYRVIQAAGFSDVEIFEPQRSQDGSFPNVPDHLPNPERSAVFGPAIESAKETKIDLVLASDPDADRIAVAVRNDAGSFVCLTGNQLGALLTDYVLSRRKAAGTLTADHFVVETLVTTPLVAEIAKSYGVQAIRDVLVGFKHIAAEIEARRPENFVFAAEESIGFMGGDYTRDKDAAIGALFALELAAELKSEGKTLLDRLDDLYGRFGYYLEEGVSTTCPGQSGQTRIRKIMSAFRQQPPTQMAGCIWETVSDYRQREVRSLPSNRIVEHIESPNGDLLIFHGRTRDCQVSVAARPSGTEPKIKFYYFIKTDRAIPLTDARNVASNCLTGLKSEMDRWMGAVE